MSDKEYEFSINLGANIRNMRTAKGLSQPALGKLMGLSDKTAARTILKWEKSERIPSAYYLMLLCQALNCKADDLIPKLPN